ncbi:hypothetical protein BGX33_004253 [Mortierella sp. NVP41]|nr:hypothetical protein BGX33_004253 [Mortierella sp. NVP41]
MEPNQPSSSSTTLQKPAPTTIISQPRARVAVRQKALTAINELAREMALTEDESKDRQTAQTEEVLGEVRQLRLDVRNMEVSLFMVRNDVTHIKNLLEDMFSGL